MVRINKTQNIPHFFIAENSVKTLIFRLIQFYLLERLRQRILYFSKGNIIAVEKIVIGKQMKAE